MARFKIISKDGTSTRYEGKLKYVGSYLKPAYLEFSEISSPTPINWAVGDYVDYPRTGMRYRLYSIPQPSKHANKESHGRAFTYSNVQLYAATKELEIAFFKDVVTADNNIHFSSSPDVATFEDINGIARRIQACMDLLYPNRWIISVASGLSDEAKEFALSSGTCLDALSRIYEIWEDTGWFHTYDESTGKDVITIGYANRRVEGNTSDPYLYGKGNGLTAIKKSQTNKDEFATRLYVYGSERNLPARYYNEQAILNGESLDIRHLMIPTSQWGKTDGLPDARKAYLENIDAVKKYGVIPKTHYFDSDDAGGNIFPTIEGATIAQIRAALTESGESAYYPSISNYPNPNERVDEIAIGDNISDNGVGKVMGKNFTDEKNIPIYDVFELAKIPADSTKITIINLDLAKYSFLYTGKGQVSVMADSAKGVLSDAGFKSVTMKVELTDDITKDKTVSTIWEMDLTKDASGWPFELPAKLSADYDLKDYQSFRVMYIISFDVTLIDKTEEEKVVSCSIEKGNIRAEFVHFLSKYFTVEVKQLGFNINEAASNGKGKTITMKTGMCAGRDFKISDAKYNSANETWTLTCVRQKDDTLGILFPNQPYKIQSGDQFALLDIAMPEILISIASNRLLTNGVQMLYKVSKVQSHYEPMIDAKVMHESNRSLREGMYMELSDEDVIENGTDYLLIDTLKIREDESNIPTYSVTLRERRKVTYKGTPSATSLTETESAEEGNTPSNNAIIVDSVMSDESTNPVGNKIIKSYVDTENKKQSYFKELGSVSDVDIPTGGGSTGGSPVGSMRLRVVNKVIYVESKSDIGGATVKFARALKKRRKSATADNYVTSHAWRVYGGYNGAARTPITQLTGDFYLKEHPYGGSLYWYDASYPYRYKVVVGTAEGDVDMNALTLIKAFARIKNGKYALHTGHGSAESAKVKMAVIIDGTFLPFRLSLNDNGNDSQSYGLNPL